MTEQADQDNETEIVAEAEPVANATEAVSEGEEVEVVVTIDGESPTPVDDETKAPEWVRKLRKEHREAQRRIRELEATQVAKEEKVVDLGAKPTLEACEYDDAKYEAALLSWHERKADLDRQKRAQEEERKSQDAYWQERVETYNAKKVELRAPDFDDAEDAVKEVLSVTQQGIIVQGAKDPAAVVYALGKRPDKAKELASIKDPVQFAFAVARLEGTLTVQTRKPTAPPDKAISGAGRPAGSVSEQLLKLKEEADRTSDYTAYFAAKAKLKKAS